MDIVNPIDISGWDETVASHRDHNFFHSSMWAEVLQSSYSYRPLYFVERGSSLFQTVVPIMEVDSVLTGKRGIALPFSDYSPPLARTEKELSSSLRFIAEYGRKAGWRYYEIRGGDLSAATIGSRFYRHILKLPQTEDALMKSFGKNTRTNIKRAKRDDVQVRVSDSLDSIRAFYRLNCDTRKRHGLPPQPFTFFRNIHEHVIASGSGLVVVASHGNAAVAGAVFFHIDKRALYKYGASDMRYKQLRPANLVMWTAIQHYNRCGYESLCFGRTDRKNEGLRRFKQSWGTEEEVIKYYRYDLKTDCFVDAPVSVFGFHNKIFARLPIPLLRMMGTLLYRHMA